MRLFFFNKNKSFHWEIKTIGDLDSFLVESCILEMKLKEHKELKKCIKIIR